MSRVKYRFLIYGFVLLFLLVFCCDMTISVKAEKIKEYTFDMESITLDDIPSNFTRSLHISDTESVDCNIKNFDVNSNGETLLCLTNNNINIYSDTAEFMYSIGYNLEGTSIALWDDDKVAVYIIRSETLVRLDKNGIIDAYKVKNTVDNSILYEQIRKARIKSGDDYSCELSYSSSIQKVFLNPTKCSLKKNGIEYTVYENKNATTNMLIEMFFYMFCLSLIAFGAIHSIINYKKTETIQQNGEPDLS